MIRTLSSLVAPVAVDITAYGAAIDDRIDIMTILTSEDDFDRAR